MREEGEEEENHNGDWPCRPGNPAVERSESKRRLVAHLWAAMAAVISRSWPFQSSCRGVAQPASSSVKSNMASCAPSFISASCSTDCRERRVRGAERGKSWVVRGEWEAKGGIREVECYVWGERFGMAS